MPAPPPVCPGPIRYQPPLFAVIVFGLFGLVLAALGLAAAAEAARAAGLLM